MTTSNKQNKTSPSILDTIENKGYTQKLVQIQLGTSTTDEEEEGHHHSDASIKRPALSENSLELKYKAVGLIGLVAW